MKLRIRPTPGTTCPQREVIEAHVEAVSGQEVRHAAASANHSVNEGCISCTGCQFDQQLGRLCTVDLRSSEFLVDGVPTHDYPSHTHIPRLRIVQPSETGTILPPNWLEDMI